MVSIKLACSMYNIIIKTLLYHAAAQLVLGSLLFCAHPQQFHPFFCVVSILRSFAKLLLYLPGLKVLNHASCTLPRLPYNESSSRSCPPSSTSRNTTARHTDFSAFTSQCLLLSVYYTALFSLQAVSTTHAQ